jgi:hypothetical protein
MKKKAPVKVEFYIRQVTGTLISQSYPFSGALIPFGISLHYSTMITPTTSSKAIRSYSPVFTSM